MKLKLAGLVNESINDGPGLRLAVFLQGCNHHCPGCHNPQTHSYEAGHWEDTGTVLKQLQKQPKLAGLTLSGGEPLDQPEACLALAQGAGALGKTTILYTGYTWQAILTRAQNEPTLGALLGQLWLLVDGPFLQEQADLSLKFKGSKNQRVIQVEKSLKSGKVVEEF